ncbi:hypothetical protein AAHC03_025996 [Spirometra sp. Aus1]
MNEGTYKQSTTNCYQTTESLPDGTIEVTDTLPKPDYYKSLRRTHNIVSTTLATTNNNGTLRRSKSMSRSPTFKPSGKSVECGVLMLDGVEQIFSIDRNAYGIHLLEEICKKHELTETEYFGLTYRSSLRVDMWLKPNEKISKQLDKLPWNLEFRVKFYPARPDDLKDDLTRYFLCLQIRQDLISGQLPCSFNTYVLLGAYVIQSEAGDYDPNVHEGIKYLAKVPFAPRDLQTNEMLARIKYLHGCLTGKTPEQADGLFLENARRLALYGVDLHRVTNETGEELSLGVYHSGILVYRGRLRMQRFSWPYILEISYKGKEFTLVVRSPQPSSPDLLSSVETLKPAQPTSPVSKTGTRSRSKSTKPRGHIKDRVLAFKCAHPALAKRLYEVVTEHHAFYRLREPSGPRRSNLLPGFDTRKYHYSSRQRVFDENGGTLLPRSSSREGGLPPRGQVRRVTAQRRPEQYARPPTVLTTPLATRKDYAQPAPFASLEDAEDLSGVQTATRSPINSLIQDSLVDESYGPQRRESRPIETPIIWNPSYEEKQQALPQALPQPLLQAPPHMPPPPERPQEQTEPAEQTTPRKRPELGREHWQMSPADCTQGLGMDLYGTDVATMLDAGWQGSRANRGIKGPGAYYYEVTILEDGDVRLGWATNSASLMLGTDAEGYGYGVDPLGQGSPKSHSNYGRFVHAGESHAMGMPAVVNDVIGCFLEIRKQPYGSDLEGNVFWAHNGQIVISPSIQEIRIPSELATESAFFPSASLKDARVAFNFGEVPFTYAPEELTGGRTDWLPPVMVPLQQVVHNVNAGWRINQFDVTSPADLQVSEDGRMIQTRSANGWHGFRANKGVFGSGKYYYEIEQVENSGMARFGWALQDGSLLLGTDNMGYAFGVGPDGSQARKVFNGLSEPYGTPFRVGDVIGCFLDLDNGIIQWSLNGNAFPEAYRMDRSFIAHSKSIFFPAGSLYNTTVSVNYGDRPFKFEPAREWYYLFAAADEDVRDSKRWPKDINAVLKMPANTERVESDVQRQDVTITVATLDRKQSHSLPQEAEISRSNSSVDKDEDTVIRTASETEFAPPPPPMTSYSESVHVEETHGEPEVQVDYYINEEGQQVKRIIQRHKKVVTTVRNASTERRETKHTVTRSYDSKAPETNGINPTPPENEDEALNRAIQQTTQLDSDAVVINGSSHIRRDGDTRVPTEEH